MKYIVSWTLPTGADYHTATDRFLKSGGLPPAGVTMLGRWHGMNRRGVCRCGVYRSEGALLLDGTMGRRAGHRRYTLLGRCGRRLRPPIAEVVNAQQDIRRFR